MSLVCHHHIRHKLLAFLSCPLSSWIMAMINMKTTSSISLILITAMVSNMFVVSCRVFDSETIQLPLWELPVLSTLLWWQLPALPGRSCGPGGPSRQPRRLHAPACACKAWRICSRGDAVHSADSLYLSVGLLGFCGMRN